MYPSRAYKDCWILLSDVFRRNDTGKKMRINLQETHHQHSSKIQTSWGLTRSFIFPHPTCSWVSRQNQQWLPSFWVSHYRSQLHLQSHRQCPFLELPCRKQHVLHLTWKVNMQFLIFSSILLTTHVDKRMAI